MKVVFQLGVYIHSLCIHLGNDPTLLQELVDPLEIYVLVDVILLCKVTAVAEINDLLRRASPFRFRFTFIVSQYPGNDNLYFSTAHISKPLGGLKSVKKKTSRMIMYPGGLESAVGLGRDWTQAQKRPGVQFGVWQ